MSWINSLSFANSQEISLQPAEKIVAGNFLRAMGVFKPILTVLKIEAEMS
jgi:hypothetical protein